MRRGFRERFPHHRLQRKPLVSDLGMHQGTCVTHVPWCMWRSLTSGGRENVPGILGACEFRNFAYLVRGPLWQPSRFSYNGAFCVVQLDYRLISPLLFWRRIYIDFSIILYDMSLFSHNNLSRSHRYVIISDKVRNRKMKALFKHIIHKKTRQIA